MESAPKLASDKPKMSKLDQHQKLWDLIQKKKTYRESRPSFDHCHDPRWYSAQLARIQKTEPLVDSHEPLVSVITMKGIGRFNRQMGTSVRQDNTILLKQLQIIYGGRSLVNDKLRISWEIGVSHNRSRNLQIFREIYDNILAFRRLQKIKPHISRAADAKWYRRQLGVMEEMSRFPLYWEKLPSNAEIVAEARSFQNPRPTVYLVIELDQIITGRVFIELYADICPTTCDNFRLLCTRVSSPSYRGKEMSRIYPGAFWRCENEMRSALGRPFDQENFKMKHDAAGIVSMMSFGPKSTRAEFAISARPLPVWNGKHVAFGKVIWGLSYLNFLAQACDLSAQGRPRIRVKITSCGEIHVDEAIEILRPKLDEDAQQREDGRLAKLLGRLLQNKGTRVQPKKSDARQGQGLNERVVKKLKLRLTASDYYFDSDSDIEKVQNRRLMLTRNEPTYSDAVQSF